MIDDGARTRIVEDLGSTLFVEAGAGSGKTSALVARVVALVSSGQTALENIAAITFTEKAATELRDRIRRKLEEDGSERCRMALEQLDGAAIGTLHSFAQRILSEHPIEAGLPPRVEVLDEVSSGVEFERRWARFRDELLADPALERPILLLLACGVKPAALHSLAQAFEDNWDLVDERVPPDAPEPPDVRSLVDAALATVDAVCAVRTSCRATDDLLSARLEEIAAHADALRSADDEVDLLEALGFEGPSFRVGNVGRQANWAVDVKQLKEAVRAAGDELAAVRDAVADACAKRLGAALRGFILSAAAERRTAGQLEFHDLLVLARSLLRSADHGPTVRGRLHQRYQRLLLDEFQDTDPIQIELAVRIAATSPRDATATWPEVDVADGHLFIVGDPKQSIYRFRRADIATFLMAEARFGRAGLVELSTNFRSAAPVIDWVNHVFEVLMSEPPEVPVPQPTYRPLAAERPAPTAGPAVSVLGRAAHGADSRADELRALEAADVAAAIGRAIEEGWSVGDAGRPARLGDITVLVPSRTSLPFLEDALDEAGIPFRAESSSLVYATRAVRDLLMVLRAADDPSDHLRIVAALRTPLLGCGDDDLFRFKVQGGGAWNYLAPRSEGAGSEGAGSGGAGSGGGPEDDPVAAGLAYLRSLHDARWWQTPSELLGRVARDRCAFELGFAEGRPRDVWRRLRFVVDQARAWSEATGGTLRQYLRWVDQQTAEGARVAESVLPETDDDAVRIMTVHGAKGLEFPITIVSGASTVPQSRAAPAQVVFPPEGPPGYKFGAAVKTFEWEAFAPIDEQMGFDERVRLLYVASTRACDHLIVSLHRRARSAPPRSGAARTNAELLVDGMGPMLAELPDAVDGSRVLGPPVVIPPSPPLPLAEWSAELATALARGAKPTAVAATALTDEGQPDPGLQKRPRDMDLPPWLKGRYGTAVGRAVHGVLQTIDLATGSGLDAAVAAQCQAEAVVDRAGDVRRLVVAALGSPSVREAAASPHWREVYACTPLDRRLLEGYVDLLYRGPEGLVVVDHKTAGAAADLDERVEGYRVQGGAYALAVAAATGEPVARVTFIFLTPDGAIERDLDDLDATVAGVRALVGSGREVMID